MTLGEVETLMRAAAAGQKNVVIVDQDGKTYRGTARSFDEWYRTEDGYARLCFEQEDEYFRLTSGDILYIEFHG